LSGTLFAYAHIVFRSGVALALTLAGGVLFARTYARTRSLLVCQIEHALYGCFLFTIGLGHTIYYAG
jgi:membrane protease YdiL (CAAX protease family)